MSANVAALLRFCGLLFLLGWSAPTRAETPVDIRTVFIILMENHNWSTIIGSPNCPYINNTLLPMASHCEQYYNPPGIHPSEPNYIWLEAGNNFGILNDDSGNRISSTNHLVTQLNKAGISWRSYQEDITTNSNLLVDQNNYVVRHDPVVLFNDVNGNNAYMKSHVRPYSEFATDLQNNTVGRYNFITPNLTNDMHNLCSGCTSTRIQGDHWLSLEIPKILASQAYSNKGAIFITWDEGDGSSSDGPIGMIVISPQAKGHGFASSTHFTHSSTLRTMQNIFGVRPYLGDAANATDLSELFVSPILSYNPRMGGSYFQFNITNLVSGSTYYIEGSTNLKNWVTVRTNTVTSSLLLFTEPFTSNYNHRFYRVKGP